MSVDPNWTGVLFVDYGEFNGYGGYFYVDGERVLAESGQRGVHGMAPRNTLQYSRASPGWTYGMWKICQVDGLPQWTVTEGDTCYIDRHGCFESGASANLRVEGSCNTDPGLIALSKCQPIGRVHWMSWTRSSKLVRSWK